MEKLLVSACLLGVECKYSGGSNALSAEILDKLGARYTLVPVCPERDGGLPTPRTPSERVGDRVLSRDGKDVTAEFEKGAALALQNAQAAGCTKALLKENSPSCGSGTVYDGSFSGVLVPGYGVTAEKLRAAGITVLGESRVYELL